MSRTEAAMRWVGAFLVLAAASALTHLPAAHHAIVLAVHAILLLGCGAIQLAPAHRAVSGLARRAAEAARTVVAALGESPRAAAWWLRWVGFTGVVLLIHALYADKVVQGFLLFLAFLTAVWAVFLSMITGKPAAEEDELNGAEVNAMDASIC